MCWWLILLYPIIIEWMCGWVLLPCTVRKSHAMRSWSGLPIWLNYRRFMSCWLLLHLPIFWHTDHVFCWEILPCRVLN